MPSESLQPVSVFFPGKSLRWIAETCRAGRIPGAVKVGAVWFIRGLEVDRLVADGARGVPSVDDAEADLRRRGVFATSAAKPGVRKAGAR